jgi:hypothetical protein
MMTELAEQLKTKVFEIPKMGQARIEVSDKRMINCRADLNQLVPFKYPWASRNFYGGRY